MAKVESIYVDQFKGKHRLLLVFSPDALNAAFEAQMNLLAPYNSDFAQRDLVLGTILMQGKDTIAGRQIDRASELGLREDLRISTDAFCVVLIDQNGEEILRSYNVVEPAVLLRALQGDADVPHEQPAPGTV